MIKCTRLLVPVAHVSDKERLTIYVKIVIVMIIVVIF